MPYTKAGQKAVDKYVKNNYDRFLITVPKGRKEAYKERAEQTGMSLNAYIISLIEKDMER